MTNEEKDAIYICKTAIRAIETLNSETNAINSLSDFFEKMMPNIKFQKDIEIIVNAFDKQIPKRVEKDGHIVSGKCCCGNIVTADMDYCTKCGRRRIDTLGAKVLMKKQVVRGKWIKNIDYCGWKCSVCGTDDDYAYTDYDDIYELQDLYCPHCGADMRGS